MPPQIYTANRDKLSGFFEIFMKYQLALLLCLFAGPVWGQDIVLPEKAEARTNRLSTVTIKSTVKTMSWLMVPAGDVDVFREHDPDPSIIRLRFVPYRDGQYVLVCAGIVGEKITQAVCVITSSTSSGGAGSPIAILPAEKSEPRTIGLGFTALARTELAKLTPEARKLADRIADNYESISAKAAASTNMTIGQMGVELDAKNSSTLGPLDRIAWASWFKAWEARSGELSAAGRLATIDHWATAYHETAIGLRK